MKPYHHIITRNHKRLPRKLKKHMKKVTGVCWKILPLANLFWYYRWFTHPKLNELEIQLVCLQYNHPYS